MHQSRSRVMPPRSLLYACSFLSDACVCVFVPLRQLNFGHGVKKWRKHDIDEVLVFIHREWASFHCSLPKRATNCPRHNMCSHPELRMSTTLKLPPSARPLGLFVIAKKQARKRFIQHQKSAHLHTLTTPYIPHTPSRYLKTRHADPPVLPAGTTLRPNPYVCATATSPPAELTLERFITETRQLRQPVAATTVFPGVFFPVTGCGRSPLGGNRHGAPRLGRRSNGVMLLCYRCPVSSPGGGAVVSLHLPRGDLNRVAGPIPRGEEKTI